MSEADSASCPRFPWVALALCVLSMGAAGWTWLGWSYAWDVTPSDFFDLCSSGPPLGLGPREYGRYVRLRGEVTDRPLSVLEDRTLRFVAARPDRNVVVLLSSPRGQALADTMPEGILGRAVELPGLTWLEGFPPIIDTTASRFHPASVAGLVVGAWGIFVFAAAFLHWRRRLRSPDAA